MKGQLSFKPGTVALVFFIAVVGYVAFTLVSGNIQQLGDTAQEDQNAALDCSELDVEFVNINSNETHTSVFFRINTDLDGVELGFENRNETALVTDIRSNRMASATLNVTDYENIYVDTGRCNDPFWWR